MPCSTFKCSNNLVINQYTKIPDSIMTKSKLSPYSKLIYGRLMYRMQLSLTKGRHYYDKQDGSYYVIYRIRDLARDIGAGRKAVINALKQLVNYGLVHKRRLIHRMELELPKFRSGTYKNPQKELINKTNTIKNNKTINTINTNNFEKYKNLNDIKLRTTKTNLIHHYHLPKAFINEVCASSSHDYNAFHFMIGLIFDAKKAALHKLVKQYSDDYKITNKFINKSLRFEYNRCYDGNLSKKFNEDSLKGQYDRAFESAKRIANKASLKYPNRYQEVFNKTIMKCLIKYFYNCGEFEITNRPINNKGPKIPIISLRKIGE